MNKESYDFRKEVESHSSNLTNQRIFNIKEVLWRTGFEVYSSKTSPLSTLNYFSIVLVYYMEIPSLIDKQDEEILDKLMMNGNIITSKMRLKGNPTPTESENLLQLTLQAHMMINQSLQKLRYFFRIGRSDPKGLDSALSIFKKNVWEEKSDIGSIFAEAKQ